MENRKVPKTGLILESDKWREPWTIYPKKPPQFEWVKNERGNYNQLRRIEKDSGR